MPCAGAAESLGVEGGSFDGNGSGPGRVGREVNKVHTLPKVFCRSGGQRDMSTPLVPAVAASTSACCLPLCTGQHGNEASWTSRLVLAGLHAAKRQALSPMQLRSASWGTAPAEGPCCRPLLMMALVP